MLKDLLEKDFVSHHGIHVSPVADAVMVSSASCHCCAYGRCCCPCGCFDLDDMPSPVQVLPLREGKVSFENKVHGEIEVVAYENFVNQCTRPASFLKGRKKCDYVLKHTDTSGYVLLLEVTSALGSIENLMKPTHKFQGGKFEKAEYQLGSSLDDLLDVPSIAKCLKAMRHCICLMAYKVLPHTDPMYLMLHPYTNPYERYLSVEAEATAENGAIVPCPMIEQKGFEYRRIDHRKVFSLN